MDMAKIEKKTVHYLADLARIAVAEDEEASLVVDLEKIVAYVEQLREVDTSQVTPCCYVTQSLTKTPLRKDDVVPTLERAVFLKITPQNTAGMLRVPTVMKQE
jgi:aspartyl-tRNA(Asn)/glutamyl-tRNA(Gln) amidotransferase subunit C